MSDRSGTFVFAFKPDPAGSPVPGPPAPDFMSCAIVQQTHQPGLAQHVEDRLRKLDSPITIAVDLGRGVWGPQGTVSHETIDRASRQVWLAPLRHGHGADTVCSAATWARAPNATS